MKSLLDLALSSLPSTLQGAFMNLYEIERVNEFKAQYDRVLLELTFRIISKLSSPLIVIEAPLISGPYFVYSRYCGMVWISSLRRNLTGNRSIIELTHDKIIGAKIKMSIYYDYWNGWDVNLLYLSHQDSDM